jgi:hypothetical protein
MKRVVDGVVLRKGDLKALEVVAVLSPEEFDALKNSVCLAHRTKPDEGTVWMLRLCKTVEVLKELIAAMLPSEEPEKKIIGG